MKHDYKHIIHRIRELNRWLQEYDMAVVWEDAEEWYDSKHEEWMAERDTLIALVCPW